MYDTALLVHIQRQMIQHAINLPQQCLGGDLSHGEEYQRRAPVKLNHNLNGLQLLNVLGHLLTNAYFMNCCFDLMAYMIYNSIFI